MNSLPNGQKIRLEILKKFDELCRKNNIKYTLTGDTLLSWAMNCGFSTFSSYICVGLLVDEYEQILQKLENELDNNYYLASSKNYAQFDEICTLMVKRGNIILTGEREKDELYYDNFIKIVPIFYAGENEKDVIHLKREFVKYRKCISARKILKGTVNIKNFFKEIETYHYYKKKNIYTYERICNLLFTNRKNEKARYVFFPTCFKNTGICNQLSTYENIIDVKYEDVECMVISDYEAWLSDFYSKEEENKLLTRPYNRVSAEGPGILRRIQMIELEMLCEIDRICRKYNIKYILAFGSLLGAIRHHGFIPWDDDIDICMLYEDYLKFLEIAPQELDNEKFFLKTQDSDKDNNLTFSQLKRNNTICCREKRENYSTHLGVFVDIFPLFNGSNNIIIHKLQHRICKYYKTMLWSHMGACAEKDYWKKKYYTWLSRVDNKAAYNKFMKWATINKKKTSRLAYLSFIRNPFGAPHTTRETYEQLIEVEFEGHLFFCPKNYEDYLSGIYTDEYMTYPIMLKREAKHLPATIELGELFDEY